MFAPLAAGLADAGHEVLAPDLPGYGLSTAPWSAIEYGAWKQALLPTLRPLSRLTRGLRVPVRWFTHMQRMSRDPALTALVCADPLGGGNRLPLGLLASLFDTAPALEPEQFQRCPVLMLHPACDDWTPVAISDRSFQRLAAPGQRVLLEACGHFPIEHPGLDQLRDALLPFVQRIAGQLQANH